MSQPFRKAIKFKAGEFYGQVPRQRSVLSSILSEVIHRELLIPKHFHENPYFTLVLEGGYSEKLANKTYIHKPMSVLWRREGVLHKEDRIGAAGAHFFTVELKPESLTNLREIASVPEDFCERSGMLVQLICRLYKEFRNWQICSGMVAEGITLEMLGISTRKNLGSGKSRPIWLARVVEKLNDEFLRNISNEELALEVGMHPVHVAAVFRRFYKQTIGEYTRNLRIHHALQLLTKKELTLADIAIATGFSDQSHFTRVFTNIVGTTPGAFRKSLNGSVQDLDP